MAFLPMPTIWNIDSYIHISQSAIHFPAFVSWFDMISFPSYNLTVRCWWLSFLYSEILTHCVTLVWVWRFNLLMSPLLRLFSCFPSRCLVLCCCNVKVDWASLTLKSWLIHSLSYVCLYWYSNGFFFPFTNSGLAFVVVLYVMGLTGCPLRWTPDSLSFFIGWVYLYVSIVAPLFSCVPPRILVLCLLWCFM